MATFSERIDAATQTIETDARSGIRTAILAFDEVIETAMVQYGTPEICRIMFRDRLVDIGRYLGSTIREVSAAEFSILLLEDADELALEDDDFLVLE